MINQMQYNFRETAKKGLLAGVITLIISVIGMVELFAERSLVADLLTMGQVLIFAAAAIFSFLYSDSLNRGNVREWILTGFTIGAFSAPPLLILIWLTQVVNLRQFFANVSPALIELLTFHQEPLTGSLLLTAAFIVIGIVAAGVSQIPEKTRRPILTGFLGALAIGLFSEIISLRLKALIGDLFGRQVGDSFSNFLFESRALRILPAAVIFALIAWLTIRRRKMQEEGHESRISFPLLVDGRLQWRNLLIIVIAMSVLPILLGSYLSEVVNVVGIFVLMGLGLNIVVGFAGLLDLGYVAFFAVGAYTMAILTSEGALGVFGISFWAALPIAVAMSTLAGIILGMPVLRMRGDYLAIVTLGFGEIIRLLALSDMLRPFIGGALGVLRIPKPYIGPLDLYLVKPEHLYFVVLLGVLLAAFVSWRLRDSRLGRQWMAMREDEDVAEAMGINLVKTKLLAFAVGAAFSGLAGAIFASKLTSIFPHSFNLLISINVLSLIIVGGIGSLPGVIVGAFILVGLPEMLREFAEFRQLMYGALLVVMMLARPEGFLPSSIHKRELHVGDEPPIDLDSTPISAAPEGGAR
ncbi:MAG: leucine/isoleucine/valine transporter permease subunit [Anaerolineae bacterium]|nr:leucine/isoleucine/valine transporter permease subunit [Anaerolineae bacterium]